MNAPSSLRASLPPNQKIFLPELNQPFFHGYIQQPSGESIDEFMFLNYTKIKPRIIKVNPIEVNLQPY